MEEKKLDLSAVTRKIETVSEIRKCEFCYLEYKYSQPEYEHNDYPASCPFGFIEFKKDKCRNCRWHGEQSIENKEK